MDSARKGHVPDDVGNRTEAEKAGCEYRKYKREIKTRNKNAKYKRDIKTRNKNKK